MNVPKIKIISDGTGNTTHIYNSDGVEIPGITKAVITIEADDFVKAELTFCNIDFEIRAFGYAENSEGYNDTETTPPQNHS